MVIWGGASKMEDELNSMGLELRRLGRVIRVKVTSEETSTRFSKRRFQQESKFAR